MNKNNDNNNNISNNYNNRISLWRPKANINVVEDEQIEESAPALERLHALFVGGLTKGDVVVVVGGGVSGVSVFGGSGCCCD